MLLMKEQLFSLFDGGEISTFYRAENVTAEDVVRELVTILNTFKLPFLRYDFGGMKGEVKLTKFI